MTESRALLEETAEDLFENAPCGYITTRMDGTIVRVNRTFESWTGRARDELVDQVRFQDLLSPGGRIYHETHYAPLLRMQGSVREIAVEIVRADGTRLPALINSVLRADESGEPRFVRTTVFDATDRRRYEQELLLSQRKQADIAHQLQRSLLAGRLPADPRLQLEVFYSAAGLGAEAGGDWYDAFWLEDDATVALVVGDVMGRGIEAAATMGQMRSAVRALAASGLGPAALLDGLDRFARRHALGVMTTLVYAELHLSTGELRYACAGHPPPVAVLGEAPPQLLWDGRSTPVDAGFGRSRAEASVALPSGSALVLYTDGLVERRTESISAGLDRLTEIVEAHRDAPPPELVPALVRELHDAAGVDDDVCVLAARVLAR